MNLSHHHHQDATTVTFLENNNNQRRDLLTLFLGVMTCTSCSVTTAFTPPSLAATAAIAPSNTQKIYKTIHFLWDDVPTGSFPMAINGQTNVKKGSTIQVSYQIPNGWDSDYDNNNNNNNNNKYYNRITVYQKTGTATSSRLEKASELGIPRALDIGDRMGYGLKEKLKNAKLTSSSYQYKSIVTPPPPPPTSGSDDNGEQHGQKYFEYVMTTIPTTTTTPSASNGGDDIDTHFLFSTTILNDRLYVFLLQCNQVQWDRASHDLLQIQSSFLVQSI